MYVCLKQARKVTPVADPGFPIEGGGGAKPLGGANL